MPRQHANRYATTRECVSSSDRARAMEEWLGRTRPTEMSTAIEINLDLADALSPRPHALPVMRSDGRCPGCR